MNHVIIIIIIIIHFIIIIIIIIDERWNCTTVTLYLRWQKEFKLGDLEKVSISATFTLRYGQLIFMIFISFSSLTHSLTHWRGVIVIMDLTILVSQRRKHWQRLSSLLPTDKAAYSCIQPNHIYIYIYIYILFNFIASFIWRIRDTIPPIRIRFSSFSGVAYDKKHK